MNETQSAPPGKLLVAFFTINRWLLAISQRMVYPFLNAFSRGLGVSLGQLSVALTLRSLAGASTPVLAVISDRYGRKAGLLVGLSVFTAGAVLVWLVPAFWAFTVGICLIILGMMTHLSAMQAYVGDAFPYEQRGRTLAIVEWGWSLSFMLGMPFIAWLIAKFGWQGPFPFLAAVGAIIFIITAWKVPATHVGRSNGQVNGKKTNLWASIRQVLSYKPAVAGLAIAGLLAASNEMVNLVFGVFLEDSFGLKLAALGFASLVIGISEWSGESLTAMLVDRLGPQRAIAIGLVSASLVAVLLYFISSTLVGAMIGLFLFYLSFEFSVVSLLPLLTNLSPAQRATIMGLSTACFALGRGIATPAATGLYSLGFGFNAGASVLLNIVALLVLRTIPPAKRNQPGLEEPS